MNWSKTMTAMVVVVALAGVAAIMEIQGRQAAARPAPVRRVKVTAPARAPADDATRVPIAPPTKPFEGERTG